MPRLGDEVDAFVHRHLAGDRIDPPAEARRVPAAERHRQRGRRQLLLHARVEQLRFEHAVEVGAGLGVAGEEVELAAEVAEREIVHRHRNERRAAAPGNLAEPEVARPDAGDGREALAERVEAHQLRLHLAELDRHRVQVLPQEVLRALRLRLLGGQHQRLQQRELELGGVAHAEVGDQEHQYDEAGNEAGRAQHQVPDREFDRPGLGQPVGHHNNMHAPPSRAFCHAGQANRRLPGPW